MRGVSGPVLEAEGLGPIAKGETWLVTHLPKFTGSINQSIPCLAQGKCDEFWEARCDILKSALKYGEGSDGY